jgi:hypothetical protein
METLENSYVKVTVLDSGCWNVVEKQSGTLWTYDPWQQSSGEIVLKEAGGPAILTLDLGKSKHIDVRKRASSVFLDFDQPPLKGSDSHVDVKLRVRVLLDGDTPDVTAEITELSFDTDRFELVHMDYPLRAFWLETHVDLGYLAIPCTQGALMPTYPVKLGATDFWSLEDRCLDIQAYQEVAPTMPWFGAFNGKAGYVCILETEDDAHISTVLNYDFQHEFMSSGRRSPYKRIAVAYPRWLACMGTLNYARRMRYVFGSKMGYVEMAKRYRRHATETGLLKTLKEKQEQRPQIAKLAGAPCIDLVCGYPHYPPTYPPSAYRYSRVQNIVEDLHKNLGLKKALFHLWGAFTRQPPKTLPFDVQPGSVDELKASIDYAQNECGYLFSLYTDFSALLQWSQYWNPDLLVTLREGGHLVGEPWVRNCSGTYLDSAREVMPVLARELGVQAAYIDCLGGPVLRECYSDRHPTTRSIDRKNRCDVFEYIRSLGLVYGGERMAAWGMAYTDYGNSIGIEPRLKLFRLFPVPLFHLVFHDSAVLYRDAFDHYAQLDGYGFEFKVLQDVLNGVPAIFYLTPFNYEQWRGRIQMADQTMSRIVTAVAYDEMLSHEFLSDDFMIQRTVFSSGVTVTTNMGLGTWDGQGEKVSARAFRATGGNLGSIESQFTTDIRRTGYE